MNPKDLEKICQHFGLGEPQSIQAVSGGLIHKMWQVKTNKGFFAIKELSRLIKFDDKIRNSYEESENIAKRFAEVGIPAISAISINERALLEIDNRFFLCYPWFVGKTLRSEIKDHHRLKMAKVLADIHRLSSQLFGEKAIELVPNCDLSELFKEVLSTDPAYKALLIKYQDTLLEIAHLYAKAIIAMPKVGLISHTDLDPKNVMWDDEQNPHLIDWEGVQAINPSHDIIQLAIDWSRVDQPINWNTFKTIIKAFKDNGGVVEQSLVRDILMLILGNALNWLAFNLKRSIDTGSSEKDLSIVQVNHTIESVVYLYRSLDQVEI